jgi:hypothetical protein
MLFALWMACAGTEVQEDREELLDRLETLEREVVALRGAKRGTVLLDVACAAPGDVVAFPSWLAPAPPAAPSVGLWTSTTTRDSEPAWRWGGEAEAADLAGTEVPCGEDDRSPYGYRQRWVAVAL